MGAREMTNWFKLLNLNRHDQDTPYYCGAAVAQMIIDFIKGRNGHTLECQAVIYDDYIKRKNDPQGGLWTDPDGLSSCLDDLCPANKPWEDISDNDNSAQEKICEKMATSLEENSLPSPVLIDEGNHWVVIIGMKANSVPSSANNSFEIKRIHIIDPEPELEGSQQFAYEEWCIHMTKNEWGQKWLDKYVGLKGNKVED